MEGFMVVFWDKKSQIFMIPIYSATELHDIVKTDLCNMINTLTNMVVMCNKKIKRKNPTLKRWKVLTYIHLVCAMRQWQIGNVMIQHIHVMVQWVDINYLMYNYLMYNYFFYQIEEVVQD